MAKSDSPIIKRSKGLQAFLVLLVFSTFTALVFANYFFGASIEQRHLNRETENTIAYIGAQHEATRREIVTIVGFVADAVGVMLENKTDIDYINSYMISSTELIRETAYFSGFVGLFVMYTDENKYFDDVGFNGAFPDIDWETLIAEGYDPTERLWYRVAEDSGKRVISSPPYENITNGEITVSVVRNVFNDEGERIAIVSMDISLENMYEFTNEYEANEGIYWMMLDRDLNVLVHPVQEIVGLNVKTVSDEMAEFATKLEQDGVVMRHTMTGFDGLPKIFSARNLNNGFYAAVVVNRSVYYENLHRFQWFSGSFGAIFATILSIAILRIARQRMKAEQYNLDLLSKVNIECEKNEKLSHWYRSILDAIPLPITITDADMKWTFVNVAVEKFLNTKLEDIIGKHCSNWNAHICGTEDCGIACVRRGVHQTYFNHNGSSYKVDIEILKDLNGETTGYIEVVQDITEIKSMAQKNAQIMAANNAKSSFLATVSHEIRTPMNTILGIAEIQLQNDDHITEAEEAFTQILYAGELLLNIINDILDLSKIESGKLELSPGNYDIPSLINDTVQLNHLRYESKPIDLKVYVDENTPLEFFGDDFRIRQILNNLLSNAYKYTDKGVIEMSVYPEEPATPAAPDDVTLVFKVKDTGQGLTEEQIGKLFEEFTRFNTDINNTVVGTGLGMSITKRLVDVLKGEISVESEQNVGSVFTVKIPQKRIGDEVCGKEFSAKLKDFSFRSRVQSKKLQAREYMPYGSVLIVDDVSSNLQVAKGMLLPYGLTIELVPSGFDAVDKIEQGNVYDIIFMDHMMPKMDGIKTTAILREKGYKNPIVALTANALAGQAEIFLNNGFDGYISKPIDSREMNSILNNFIRNRKPTEVVEAARLEQKKMQEQVKQNKRLIIQGNNNSPDMHELEKCFVWDAENAMPILDEISGCSDSVEEIEKANIHEYVVAVHGMKSALSNINEKELAADALKLEKAGKARDYAVIAEMTPAFVSALKDLVAKHSHRETELEWVVITENDKAFLGEKLNELKNACDKLDKKAAKVALKELTVRRKSWDSETNEFLNELNKQLLHSAFKKVSALIEEKMN